MAETRKREKPTPRPPEQRRGSPNRQEHGPQRTAEESNLTHNHVSEPISSRTQQPRWITVQNGETKQPSSTRGAQQEPAHHPPNVGHQRPTGGTNHRATRRYNLAYTRLHDLVAKASSKSHSAFLRPLGSRFTGTSATYPDGLPRLTVPPRAFNVSGALPATRILTAKFASQSMDRLQAPQLNTHPLRGSLAFATPQHAPTRTRIQLFRFPQYQSRDSNSHAQPGTRF